MIRHDALLVTIRTAAAGPGRPAAAPGVLAAIAGYRAALPRPWRTLLIGPVPSVENGYVTYLFGPDGSKENWPESADGEAYRRQFADLFTWTGPDGSSPFDVVAITYGGDYALVSGPIACDGQRALL